MLSFAPILGNGMIETSFGDVNPSLAGPARAAVGAGGCGLFGRLVSVYQSNEVLLSELKSANVKFARARSYLETPGGNPRLARVHLNQIKARRSAVLTMLRANRLEARALLATVAVEDDGPDPTLIP